MGAAGGVGDSAFELDVLARLHWRGLIARVCSSYSSASFTMRIKQLDAQLLLNSSKLSQGKTTQVCSSIDLFAYTLKLRSRGSTKGAYTAIEAG